MQTEREYRELLSDLNTEKLTFVECFTAYKKIRSFLKQHPAPDNLCEVKIALIGSFTLDPLAVCLDVLARQAGFNPSIFQGGFNLYPREILDPSSPLYGFAPDAAILSLDTETFFGDACFLTGIDDGNARRNKIGAAMGDLTNLADSFLKRSPRSILILNSLSLPLRPPAGIPEEKSRDGFVNLIREANRNLRERFADQPRVFILDLEGCLAAYGKKRASDPRLRYLARIPFAHDFFPHLASEYIVYLRAAFGMARKVLVLDLDNTIWGGIAGEAGWDKIELGDSPAGEAYVDLQKHILSLSRRGVLLAVNSKNNYADAAEVFRKHPRMVLKEEMFAALRINWGDKVENMEEIARELNLGLDSFVFLDDSPVERGFVASALPEVLVPRLPDDPLLFPEFIGSLTVFEKASLTEEDAKKTILYRQRQEAEKLRTESGSLEDYLKKLEMKALIRETGSFTLPRVHQLFGKTNQFNLTTKRYTLPQIEGFLRSGRHKLWNLELSDRFGDNGIVATALVELSPDKKVATIDSFLMSCRVIGRFVEDYFLAHICAACRAAGATKLIGLYAPTEKNAPVKDVYPRLNFNPAGQAEGCFRYELDLEKGSVPAPEWIAPAGEVKS